MTGMNTSKKTFAQKYSSEFEKIVLEMVEEALQKDFEIIVSNNTEEKSDGGYDGYIFIKSSYDETSTALLEAKLRTAIKDLPLSDFSKSVIIAVNLDAACIIIGTNLYFSGNTIEQLETFIYNTGLEIRTLDYKDILEWLNRNPEKCKNYKKLFITNLRKYAEKDYNTACRELSLFEKPPVLDRDLKSIKLYGKERKKIRADIIAVLKKSPTTFVINGETGIGKKTLLECLFNELLSNNNAENNVRYVVHKIDMSLVMSQNDFIYRIISMLWGCGYNDTVDFFYGLSNSNFSNALVNFLPKKLLDILTKLSYVYKNDIDIDVFFSYIADLYKKTIQRHKIQRIFYFYNLEYSQDTITNQLVITFIRKMTGVLSIILSIPNDNLLNDQKQGWIEFCNAVNESNNIISYQLKEWDNDTAINFVKDHCNDTGISRYSETIINYFGKKPICLATGIEMINSDKMLLSYIKSGSLILDKSMDINKLKSAIIHNIKELSNIQCHILYLNVIIAEKINNQFLSSVLNMDIKVIMKETESISYLIINSSFCQWKNRLFLNMIKDIDCSFLLLAEKYSLYSCIIKNIDMLEVGAQKKKEILLQIYIETGNIERVLDLSQTLLQEYKTKLQYNSIFLLTTTLINSEVFYENDYYNIYFRINWLLAAFNIGFNGDDTDFSEKLSVLQSFIQEYEEKYSCIDVKMNFMLGEFYYISSLIYLAKSQYFEMQSNIKLGLKYLKEIQDEESLKLQSELCANYATSLKHLINIEKCVEYLENNETIQFEPRIAKMPKYIISYYSHHASLYTGSEPQKSLDEFNRIKKICENYSKEAYLHNLHNIASMKFIIRDYDGALKDAEIVYKESYENNISIEFGRCQNLLGCIKWHDNEIDKAKNYFKCSYEHFKKHQHNTHMWAPLVNLAVLCRDTDDPDMYKYTHEASEFLLNNHINQIKTAIVKEDNIPKIVVAVLMIMYNLDFLDANSYEMQNLKETIQNKNNKIIQLYDAHIQGKILKELFINTAYNCEGKVMLKV